MFNIVKAPNPILRSDAKLVKKITDKHQEIIKEMVQTTLSFEDPEGVGLAATQIGISEQFFIAKFDVGSGSTSKPEAASERAPTSFVVVFNPKILWVSKKERTTLEGCLSIPEYYGDVARPSTIKVSYQDLDGKEIKETLRGVNATIFQHEFDHLHGRLFIDLVMQQKSRIYKIVGKDERGDDIFEEVSL